MWNNPHPIMNLDTDTIAALATAPGEGAIAVIRVSGPESLALADRIFVGAAPLPSQRAGNTFIHGHVALDDGLADEVILLIYRAPHSYTREDSIEIQGHGGMAAARRILRAVLNAGARPAEAGEFTKRAFLGGRMDLLQAEAVLDLIRARSDRSAAAALEQLDGRLSDSFGASYDEIMATAADLEATLDFSEDELPPTLLGGIVDRLRRGEQGLRCLLDTWDEGHFLREGALIVISGKPNVGKSTLLNALLGMDRAIVTPIPGTTRDTIEESLVIDGYPVRIMDTAGLRESSCEIESEGIRRARSALQRADLILYLVDGSQPAQTDDISQIKVLPRAKTVVLINKTDLPQNFDTTCFTTDQSVIYVSLLTSFGLPQVKAIILDRLAKNCPVQPHAVISERHRKILVSARKEVTEAVLLLRHQQPEIALAASRLRAALEILGEATGRVYHDELLNSIFSRFCIGK
jgi:tRNA modification GTPase